MIPDNGDDKEPEDQHEPNNNDEPNGPGEIQPLGADPNKIQTLNKSPIAPHRKNEHDS